ncbi:DUF4276 family protein [Candidatus Electronema sp. TJ]|uniref:DUF4276 family protein n=1 Tax=Candidatus Electronema sp. TJ TaxID=3401573 RepID=UPI003AA970A7
MTTLVFFLEEPSAKEMLQGILPKLLPEQVSSRFIVFEGKQDLEKQLVRKMRLWNKPDSRFIVMRDQDAGDCRKIKDNLLKKCHEAGKTDVVMRIACHELESFYLGDLQAVEQGLELTNLAKLQKNKKYREPDSIPKAAQELLRLTKKYDKVSGSRAIGKHLHLDGNCSRSFNVLVKAIRDIVAESIKNN